LLFNGAQSDALRNDRARRSVEEERKKREKERSSRSKAQTTNITTTPATNSEVTAPAAATNSDATSANTGSRILAAATIIPNRSPPVGDNNGTATITPNQSPPPAVGEEGSSDPVIVSLADSQVLRDRVMTERLLEYDNSNKPESHKCGKPPNSIPQQNDRIVILARNKLLLAAAKFAEVSSPVQPLAVGKYPKQQFCLVIINKVQDNDANGAPSKNTDPRSKPQMIVAASNTDAVYDVGKELFSGYATRSERHDMYEHARMFTPDEAQGFIDKSTRTRNVGGVRSIHDCVGDFFNPQSS
jgi:hypothetical protein